MKGYYYIRVGVHTRVAGPIAGPRAASQYCYGVIYDHVGQYLFLGTRSPRYMSKKAINKLVNNKSNWKPIPNTGP